MLLGYEGAEHYYGGLAEWRAAGRYLVVETPEVVEALVGAGAVPVDVRDRLSYAEGHIPGARSAPLAEILADPAGALAGIGAERTILLYDEGDGDTDSRAAARALESGAFPGVRRYGGGFSEWSASGRPVE